MWNPWSLRTVTPLTRESKENAQWDLLQVNPWCPRGSDDRDGADTWCSRGPGKEKGQTWWWAAVTRLTLWILMPAAVWPMYFQTAVLWHNCWQYNGQTATCVRAYASSTHGKAVLNNMSVECAAASSTHEGVRLVSRNRMDTRGVQAEKQNKGQWMWTLYSVPEDKGTTSSAAVTVRLYNFVCQKRHPLINWQC